MKHPAIRFSIAILISVGALYLAFRGVSLSLLLAELAKTNIWLILLGVALLFCSHVCRAWRWTVIVRPMKAKTSALVGFRAIMGGYAMNNIIPRSGELVRPYIFAKHEKVFMSGTIATILIERVVDLIANILFIMLALVIFPREIAAGFPAIAGSMTGIAIGGFVVLALVMIMIFSAGKTERTLHRITANWPEKIRAPIYRAASEFASGLRGVRASGAWPVVLGTAGIWIFYTLSMYAWLFAFPERSIAMAGIVGAFFLRVVSGIAFLHSDSRWRWVVSLFYQPGVISYFPSTACSCHCVCNRHSCRVQILLHTTVIGLVFVAQEGRIRCRNFGKVVRASEHSPGICRGIARPIAKVGSLGLEQ